MITNMSSLQLIISLLKYVDKKELKEQVKPDFCNDHNLISVMKDFRSIKLKEAVHYINPFECKDFFWLLKLRVKGLKSKGCYDDKTDNTTA